MSVKKKIKFKSDTLSGIEVTGVLKLPNFSEYDGQILLKIDFFFFSYCVYINV